MKAPIALPALSCSVALAFTAGPTHAQTPQTPCNAAVNATGAVTFTWGSVGGALTYELQADTTEFYFSDALINIQTAGTTEPVSGLFIGKTYYWHVRWNDGPNGEGTWFSYGSECSFTTVAGNPPPVPTVTSPISGGAGYVAANMTCAWSEQNVNDTYDVQIATNTAFTSPVVNLVDHTLPSCTSTTLVAGSTYYFHVRARNTNGTSAWSATRTFYTRTVSTALNLKVFLQGPLNGTTLLMGDGLRTAGLIPAQEPYTGLGFAGIWNGGAMIGAGVLTTTGNNAIVDWLYVELRHGVTNAPQYQHALLVQRDGDVVTPTGTTPSLIFPMAQSKISVRHRNHLGACTAANITANGTPITVDMTLTGTALYGTDPTATVNGRRALWAGETTGDGIAKYTGLNNDRDPILTAVGASTPTNTTTGYSRLDCTMDGVIKYTGLDNDRDPILITVGGSTPNNTRTQQLP